MQALLKMNHFTVFFFFKYLSKFEITNVSMIVQNTCQLLLLFIKLRLMAREPNKQKMYLWKVNNRSGETVQLKTVGKVCP